MQVVAEYDYYTLEQAKRLLEREKRRKIRRIKKAIINELKWGFALAMATIIPVTLVIIYHCMYGY